MQSENPGFRTGTSYSRTPGELAGADTTTTVTVYGDGRVVVRYPPYGARQGDYTMTLIKAELDELVASVVNNGVVEFDAQAAQAEKQAILDAQGMGFHVSDADIITIEIELASYNATGDPGQETFNVRREIDTAALQADAGQFPSVQSLVNLAAAERQLMNLIDSENLSPLR